MSASAQQLILSSMENLVEELNRNLKDLQFAVAVFASAAFNYKCESLLKPFPPMFVCDGGDKDIPALVSFYR